MSVTYRAWFSQLVIPFSQPFNDLLLAQQSGLVKMKISLCIHLQDFVSSLIRRSSKGKIQQFKQPAWVGCEVFSFKLLFEISYLLVLSKSASVQIRFASTLIL